jgi:hypothetical protein
VVSADNVADVGSDNSVLHAIDVATGSQRWGFDGGADFGVDLSTAPLLLAGGELIRPGPRHRLYGLSAAGKLRWILPGEADLLTPVLDRKSGDRRRRDDLRPRQWRCQRRSRSAGSSSSARTTAMSMASIPTAHCCCTEIRGKGELWTAAAVDERGDAHFASRTAQI